MKTRGDFHFKKFSVSHDNSTHKVGTDGVLLGAWTNVENAKDILDIGTGSGVIALMLAQRTPESSHIDAVEINERDAAQAKENFKRSPWAEKISIHNTSIQDFKPNKTYDLIVSNPPFFINSYLPPDADRTKARHTSDLPFEDIIQKTKSLLKATGRLSIVLPPNEATKFTELASGHNLKLQRQLSFQSRKHKPVERLLLEFGFENFTTERTELLLYQQNDEWTESYRGLMKDFLLKA